jgi:hypothetical protein
MPVTIWSKEKTRRMNPTFICMALLPIVFMFHDFSKHNSQRVCTGGGHISIVPALCRMGIFINEQYVYMDADIDSIGDWIAGSNYLFNVSP